MGVYCDHVVTVMDDYSRFILGWKLQKDMSANSLIEVVQEAVDATGMRCACREPYQASF